MEHLHMQVVHKNTGAYICYATDPSKYILLKFYKTK